MAVSEYRKMLFHLSEQITSEELKSLKYLCTEFIVKRKLERITRAIDLFAELECQENLSDTNFTLLRDLLELLQRRDLLSLVDKFSRGKRENFTVEKRDGKVPRSGGKTFGMSSTKKRLFCQTGWELEKLVNFTDSDECYSVRPEPVVESCTSDSKEEGRFVMVLHPLSFSL